MNYKTTHHWHETMIVFYNKENDDTQNSGSNKTMFDKLVFTYSYDDHHASKDDKLERSKMVRYNSATLNKITPF